MVETLYKNMVAFLSHYRISIFDILIDPNPSARPKNNPQVFWVHVKLYSTVISENFIYPDKKTNIIRGI